MAQSVEQLIRNQQVAGSNPVTSSTKKKRIPYGVLFFLQTDNGLRITARRFDSLAGDGNPFVLRTFPLIGEFPVTSSKKKDDNFMLSSFFLGWCFSVCFQLKFIIFIRESCNLSFSVMNSVESYIFTVPCKSHMKVASNVAIVIFQRF